MAGGNISWDIDGNVTFANSVKLAWTQITGTDGVMTTATYIDANGIFTGKISANNITAGTISTASIKCEGKWELNADGCGMLASGNISWDKTGKANFTGKIIANSGSIGGFEIGDGHIGVTATASGESSSADWANLSIYKDFLRLVAVKGMSCLAMMLFQALWVARLPL